METIRFKFRGSAPIIIQSDRLANPIDPMSIALSAITGKKKKTETDHRDIAWIEFQAQIYIDSKIGPYIPALNIDACVSQGATNIRRGTDVKKAFMVLEDRIPIEYEGPRVAELLFKDSRFVDFRSVVLNKKKRMMRTRPIFRDWTLNFEAAFDPDIFSRRDLIACVEAAGRYAGLGTYRPRFGRFIPEVIDA